jgi:hypothetical protein
LLPLNSTHILHQFYYVQVFWGGTLFHVDDLPFKLGSMPPNYSDFRQALRSRDVRQPVEPPAQLKGLPAAM